MKISSVNKIKFFFLCVPCSLPYARSRTRTQSKKRMKERKRGIETVWG